MGDNMDRIAHTDYVPTKQDIIKVRARSSGIVEKILTIKNRRYHIFDVGGQKSERRKWIKCFGDGGAIGFVISLSCYDELMYEDATQNKMEDAMQLFVETIGRKVFAATPIILLLNKKDLFAKKIKSLPITVDPTFDDFDGTDAHDYGQTTAFIQKKFEAVNSSSDRMMYAHLTCALYEENVKSVFKGIDLLTVRNNMKKGGLI